MLASSRALVGGGQARMTWRASSVRSSWPALPVRNM